MKYKSFSLKSDSKQYAPTFQISDIMRVSLAVCPILLVVLVFGTEASPLGSHPEASTFDETIFAPVVADHGDRHKRVTCDLLSFNTPWGSFGHAACAAHCLALMKGYRGGYCENGVCHCRK